MIVEAEVLFEKVKPVIWIKTKSVVNLGVTSYDINFAYTDPCSAFSKHITNNMAGEKLSSDQENSLKAFANNCKALYILEWEKEVEQLLATKLPTYIPTRKTEGPYKESDLTNLRARRHVNESDQLTLDNYENEGNEEPQSNDLATKLAVTGIAGPLAALITSRREQQLSRIVNRLATLKRILENSTNVDLFLLRLMQGKTNSSGPLYPANTEMVKVKLTNNYHWWEVVSFSLIPNLFPVIYERAMERTHLAKIEELKGDIRKIMNTDAINGYLTGLADEFELAKSYEDNRTKPHRTKRGIVATIAGELAKQAIGQFTGNIVSNLISYAIEIIYPNSNMNRLGRLETAFKDFEQNFEISREMNRGILDHIDKLSNIVQETLKRVDDHVKKFPEYTWLSSLIVNKITQAALDLQRITDEAKRGRVATAPLARLTGIENLREIPSSDTQFLSVLRVNNHTLNLKFTVMENSKDTKVYKVHAFEHWDNLDATPRLMRYTGASYLIYNEDKNCIKALTAVPDEYVSDQCLELDGDDPALNQWEIVKETEDIETYINVSQVKKTILFNYIYCFPGSITIDTRNYKCPMEVFKLKPTHEFQTAQQRHRAWSKSHETAYEFATDAVHEGQFRDDSDTIQHLAMFEALRNERRMLRSKLDEEKKTIKFQPGNPWIWILASIYLTSVGGALTYFLFMCYCARKVRPPAPEHWSHPLRDLSAASKQQRQPNRSIQYDSNPLLAK